MTEIPNNIIYELSIETAKLLNENQEELSKIIWTNGEANIDTEYSNLSCKYCLLAWEKIKEKYLIYNQVKISCNTPDINITFSYPKIKDSKHKIELKSSKSKKIPGSTIKKLNINQPLIFCLRPKDETTKKYIVRCSQYHHAMGDSNIDLFQDRTPRPIINFEKMKDVENFLPFTDKEKNSWIEHYAKCSLNRIRNDSISQKSWQDDMIKIIKKNILEEYINKTTEEQFSIDKAILQFEKTSIV